MADIRGRGDRIWFTTDGQMCIDTPYCAFERLIPHFAFKVGAEGYEYWGADWFTYDAWKFGWHSFISQSAEPGTVDWVRYPSGDGFIVYPGGSVGVAGAATSIRLEMIREGVEDWEYLHLLTQLVDEARAAGKDASVGETALDAAALLTTIPNAGGRYSTQVLPDPRTVLDARDAVAHAIEALGPGPAFMRGDPNASGGTDISDAIFTLSYLFANGPEPSCLDAADANDSGDIDIADVVTLLSYLFANAPALPAPFDACGADPTTEDDDLDCAGFSPCAQP